MPEENELLGGLEPMGDTKISPGVGVGAIALSLAMKYHDISTIKDGQLYQQYKLEGKNMTALHLDMVFETAVRIERHLLASSERIAALLIDAITEPLDEEQPEQPE